MLKILQIIVVRWVIMEDKKVETKKVNLKNGKYDDNYLTRIEKLMQDLEETTQKVSLLRLIDDTKKFMQSEGAYYYSMLNPNLDYMIRIYYNESRRNKEKSLEVYFNDTNSKECEKVLEYDFRNYKLKNYKKGEWQKFLRSEIQFDRFDRE